MALQIIGTSSELTTIGVIAVVILAVLWHVLDKTFRKLMFQVCHTHVKLDRLAEMIPDGGPPAPSPPSRRHTAHAGVKEGCHDEEPEPSLNEVLMRWHASTRSPGEAQPCARCSDGNRPPIEGMQAQGCVVLLLGCGTPEEPLHRLRECHPRHLAVVDASPALLEATRRRLAAEGLEAELLLVPAEGLPLPLPDGSVDCVDCVGALQHGSPLESRLSEIARVLAQRHDPVLLESLAPESRRFLAEVEIDPMGHVVHRGRPAGCELVFEVARPRAAVTPA